jgi:hypothetical protein
VVEPIAERVNAEKIIDPPRRCGEPGARAIRERKRSPPNRFVNVDRLCEITAKSKRRARVHPPPTSHIGNPCENTLLPVTVAELQTFAPGRARYMRSSASAAQRTANVVEQPRAIADPEVLGQIALGFPRGSSRPSPCSGRRARGSLDIKVREAMVDGGFRADLNHPTLDDVADEAHITGGREPGVRRARRVDSGTAPAWRNGSATSNRGYGVPQPPLYRRGSS